jgi:hypothetical protein
MRETKQFFYVCGAILLVMIFLAGINTPSEPQIPWEDAEGCYDYSC